MLFRSLRRDVGIFVGIMNTDFASIAGSESVYAATGTQVSIASGRLAFALGTQGPCASIDTACSSALVALDAAMLSLRACDTALAAAAAPDELGVESPPGQGVRRWTGGSRCSQEFQGDEGLSGKHLARSSGGQAVQESRSSGSPGFQEAQGVQEYRSLENSIDTTLDLTGKLQSLCTCDHIQ